MLKNISSILHIAMNLQDLYIVYCVCSNLTLLKNIFHIFHIYSSQQKHSDHLDRLHGHLDILETSSGSDNIVQSCKVRQSAPIFRHLAQLLVRENPLLFDQYFELESRSLLLSTQVDLGWAERPHAKAFTAFELIQKVRFWSLALNEAHEDLDLHYSFNESRSMLLDGYSDALRKMIRLVVER